MGDRPCRFCVANMDPYPVDPKDCEIDHRDDPRVYALAEALARVFQGTRSPTDRQIAWFLADADEVGPGPDQRRDVRRAGGREGLPGLAGAVVDLPVVGHRLINLRSRSDVSEASPPKDLCNE